VIGEFSDLWQHRSRDVAAGEDLHHAALEFVETVEFVPAGLEGKAVEATTPMRIVFKLTN
jgi:hypothetical protein